AMKAKSLELQTRYDQILADIESGKYAAIDQVVDALYPHISPFEQDRTWMLEQQKRWQQFQQQQKQQGLQQAQAGQDAMRQFFMNQKFDPTTVGGAVGTFVQARYKKDAVAMADF